MKRTIAVIWSWFAALWRHPESVAAGTGWRAVVEQVIAELETLNGSTERDFLAVGGKLMEFHGAAREISSEMAALTELISGEHAHKASHALDGMLELSREMEARTGQSGQAMESVRDLSSRIQLAFSGIRNTVSVFGTLCTLTRIETSRLGNTGVGFGDLADEVKRLAESIQASGEGVLEASERLDLSIQSALRGGAGLRLQQLKELPGLIAAVMTSLRSFEERQQKARAASVRQAAQYKQLGEAIDNLVTCVQFHDITRQQIEHVIQALGHIRSESPSGRGGGATLPASAQTAVALQSSHLSSAGKVFASSVAGIEGDLESIGVRLRDMAEASGALMGVSGDEQDSFFVRMEGCFAAILKAVGTCATAQTEMRSTAATLEETIGRMGESVAAIRGIEIQIQRIALNATIRAVHIGTAGNALSVIAEVMQSLALNSNRNTEDVAGALDAMSAAVRDVAGCPKPGASGVERGTGVVDEMRTTILELHSSSECSFSRVSQIAALGSRLGDEIGALRSGFSAGRRVAEVVERACRELARIGAGAKPDPSEDPGADAAQELEKFAQHYTMQMERDVHASVAGGAALAPLAGAVAPAVALEEGDLGDNVELF